MPIIPFNGITPRVAEDVFIAEGAMVIGDVTIGSGSSIWYNTVVRGDIEPIIIGKNSNIQDNSTVHVQQGYPVIMGDNVSVGHGAVVHGARVEDGAMIAIHATVLSGSTIGSQAIVAAGALVPEGKSIPPRALAVGVPAKVLRELREADLERVARTARNYMNRGKKYKAEQESRMKEG